MLNIGNEAIKSQMDEYANDTIEAIDATLMIGDLTDVLEADREAEQLIEGMENLETIKASIEANGITPSLEGMFGATMAKGQIPFEEATSSCEAIVERTKIVLRKVWEFIMKMVAKMKDFFAKRFGSFAKYAKSLKKLEEKLTAKDATKRVIDNGADKTVSGKSFAANIMNAIFSDTVKTVETHSAMLESFQMDAIKDGKDDSGLFTIEKEEEEGIITLKLVNEVDDELETDRKPADVVGNDANFIKLVGNAVVAAKGMKGHYGKMQKALAKAQGKIDKEMKKSAYDDASKKEAKNARTLLSFSNKVINLMLGVAATGMGNLSSVPLKKEGTGN